LIAFNQKPEKRKTTKGRKLRKAGEVVKRIREIVVERDGYCRLAKIVPAHVCCGVSQWSHWGDWKRYKTRNQDPERRHVSMGSLMLCLFSHYAYDKHHIHIEALTERGCDGPLRVRIGSAVYEETDDLAGQ
jgi:hypothetical protein